MKEILGGRLVVLCCYCCCFRVSFMFRQEVFILFLLYLGMKRARARVVLKKRHIFVIFYILLNLECSTVYLNLIYVSYIYYLPNPVMVVVPLGMRKCDRRRI